MTQLLGRRSLASGLSLIYGDRFVGKLSAMGNQPSQLSLPSLWGR